MLWVAGLVAGGSLPLSAPAAAPLEEIREILRVELVPEPTAAALQALSREDLERGLERLDRYAVWSPAGAAPHAADAGDAIAGIGATLEVREGRAWLLPRQGGPLAGLGFSDRIELTAVDGQLVAGIDAAAIAALLQGERETAVRLALKSRENREPGAVRLYREPIQPLDVELWRTEDSAVLRITDFVAGRTRTALDTTLELLNDDPGRIVIDLRHAGGGDLYEAIDAAGMLLQPGTVLGTLHGRQDRSVTLRASSRFRSGPPLVLLVGPSTASAAEVFAGILQFHRRAVLVGQPTFGKCHSQTERRLRDGSTLRFTNLELRFPDDSTCTGTGLFPEIHVSDDRIWDFERVLASLAITDRP